MNETVGNNEMLQELTAVKLAEPLNTAIFFLIFIIFCHFRGGEAEPRISFPKL